MNVAVSTSTVWLPADLRPLLYRLTLMRRVTFWFDAPAVRGQEVEL